jgi:hypothetical protein
LKSAQRKGENCLKSALYRLNIRQNQNSSIRVVVTKLVGSCDRLVKTISITAWRVIFEDLKKEQKMMRYLIVFSSVFLLLACASAAMADPAHAGPNLTVSPDPSLPDWASGSSGEVNIDDTSNGASGIYLDPNAGPWVKQFVGMLGVNSIKITEKVHIQGNPLTPGQPPWTDWDELIDPIKNPVGWQWVTAPAAPTVTPSDDVNVTGTIKTVYNTNDFVEFDFNHAENPGVVLTIVKYIKWTGAPGANPQQVWLDQYPTPEPGTIVLLTTGLLALGLGYIRRRK